MKPCQVYLVNASSLWDVRHTKVQGCFLGTARVVNVNAMRHCRKLTCGEIVFEPLSSGDVSETWKSVCVQHFTSTRLPTVTRPKRTRRLMCPKLFHKFTTTLNVDSNRPLEIKKKPHLYTCCWSLGTAEQNITAMSASRQGFKKI